MRFSLLLKIIWSVIMGFQQLGSLEHVTTSDPILRRTEEYREYCPFTKTCTENVPTKNVTLWDSAICCSRCRCDSDCGLNCCPDISANLESEEDFYNAKEIYTCVDAQYRPFDETIAKGLSYTMVSNCPFGFNDTEIASKCVREYADTKFDVPLRYILPAYDEESDQIYKNIFCAECHNVITQSLIYGGLSLKCYNTVPSITRISDLESNQKRMGDCNLVFEHPLVKSYKHDWIYKRCQRKLVSNCNATGLWKTYDRHLEESCLSYKSLYYLAINETQTHIMFKNVHCALCNGNEEAYTSIKESCIEFYPRDRTDSYHYVFRFISYLDWTKYTDRQLLGGSVQQHQVDDNLCTNNSLFDITKTDDWVLLCLEGLTLNNDSCVIQQLSAQPKIVLKLHLVLEPLEIHKKKKSYGIFRQLSFLVDEIERNMHLLISNDLKVLKVTGFFTFKRKTGTFVLNGSRFGTDSVENINIEIHFLVNSFKRDYLTLLLDFALVFQTKSIFREFLVNYRYSHEDLSFGDAHFQPDICESYLSYHTYSFCIRKKSINSQKVYFYISNAWSHMYIFNTTVNIEPEPFCPRVALPKLHICNTTVDHIDIFSDNLLQKRVSENDTHVFFCYPDYVNYLNTLKLNKNKTISKQMDSQVGLDYLAIVCLSLSIVCLVLTLLVYSLYPSLRTLPGLNNMALVCCLFVFQASTLIKAVTIIKLSWLCSFLGVLIHFSLILSFVWMFVCTMHMVKVFSSIRNRTVGSNASNKTFICYNVFTIFIAFLVVGTTILVSMLQSDGYDIGYGGYMCYIKNTDIVLFVVAIPVAVMVLSNFTMFGIVVYKVYKIPRLASSNTRERNYIAVFIKLSTITGMTWIFGFLYIFSRIEAFVYLFVIFNAGQGVFIMLSFVCNKRILDLFSESVRVMQSSSGQTTRTSVKLFR